MIKALSGLEIEMTIIDQVSSVLKSAPTNPEHCAIILALINWMHTQEVEDIRMCTALLMFVGMWLGISAESDTELDDMMMMAHKTLRSAARVGASAKEVGVVGK